MLPALGSPDPGNSRPRDGRAQRIERGSPVTTLAGLLVADGSQSPTMKRLCTGERMQLPAPGCYRFSAWSRTDQALLHASSNEEALSGPLAGLLLLRLRVLLFV
jgi:hypothetical protein